MSEKLPPGWVKLTEVVNRTSMYVNLTRAFGVYPLTDTEDKPFTRIWSGDQAGVAIPDPARGQLVPRVLPFAVDVAETPEEIFKAAGRAYN